MMMFTKDLHILHFHLHRHFHKTPSPYLQLWSWIPLSWTPCKFSGTSASSVLMDLVTETDFFSWQLSLESILPRHLMVLSLGYNIMNGEQCDDVGGPSWISPQCHIILLIPPGCDIRVLIACHYFPHQMLHHPTAPSRLHPFLIFFLSLSFESIHHWGFHFHEVEDSLTHKTLPFIQKFPWLQNILCVSSPDYSYKKLFIPTFFRPQVHAHPSCIMLSNGRY